MFKSYDSYEAMQADMQKARERADAAVTPAQAKVAPGDFVLRYDPEAEVVIYTEILDPVACDREAGADEDELEYLRQRYAEAQHYRFGRHYSVMCPEGELGDLHVCTVGTRVDRALFEVFRGLRWPENPAKVRQVLAALGTADAKDE